MLSLKTYKKFIQDHIMTTTGKIITNHNFISNFIFIILFFFKVFYCTDSFLLHALL